MPLTIGCVVALRIIRYVRAFGIKGVPFYLKSKSTRGHYFLRPPGLEFPVRLRAGVTDRRTFDQVFVSRQYDVAFPGTPRTIVDAGANIGLASVWFASRWPDARILAIEPEARNFELLRGNTNAIGRITAIRGALWSRSGTVAITNPSAPAASFRVGESAEARYAVPAYCMSDLIRIRGISQIDILKMDIEGAEREVFGSPDVSDWLQHVRMLIVELHERYSPGCSAEFERAVAAFISKRWKSGENEVALL
jgi:FkbM family methyltransferase